MRKKFIRLPSAKEKAAQLKEQQVVAERIEAYMAMNKDRFAANLKLAGNTEASGVLAGPTK